MATNIRDPYLFWINNKHPVPLFFCGSEYTYKKCQNIYFFQKPDFEKLNKNFTRKKRYCATMGVIPVLYYRKLETNPQFMHFFHTLCEC